MEIKLQKELQSIIALTEKISRSEGRSQTVIPFLSIYRISHRTRPLPIVLTPALCMVLQGTKYLHIGQNTVHYQAGSYIASLVDIPVSAQIVDVTKKLPYIGLRIHFTAKEIVSVLLETEIDVKPKANDGAFIGSADADLLDMLTRLLKLTGKPKTAGYLSELIKREIIYYLLSGECGHHFVQQALIYQKIDHIGSIIAWIKENYYRSFTVEELAKTNNMSVSALHRKFKAITSMGPLQYQKRLRLQEARRLMLSGSVNVSSAAMEVGYDSPSQFSREYRRLFGLAPLQDMKAVREKSAADEDENG
ncbi:AraC family transcriptional regulator [Paenibacillus humicola]|uniref:AraC family transcriptional regulator n=1 Tax=Paenibacillus humicola TaxID=3110540 RepID=UPI00237A7D29|nr:AraC family transcriptional regulator [Paenibacillus humicola]